MTADDIIDHLRSLGSEANRAGMARYGIDTSRAFGVPNAVLRPLARQIGRDHDRALALWDTGWREARLLALFTDEPARVSVEQARRWAEDFGSWEMVDHAAALFIAAGRADPLIGEFAADEREFVRRAAFAMMAWGAIHLKKAPDADILAWLPLIERHAGDGRNYVGKAVHWALRQIGKRNLACHGPALALARKLAASPDKARRRVGNAALRELTQAKVLDRLHAKSVKGNTR